MNENMKKMLYTDPVKIAETIVGGRYVDLDGGDISTALQINDVINNSKSKHLNSCEDTHYGTDWEKFVRIAEEYGFVEGYSKSFKGRGSEDKGFLEHEIILYHTEMGLVLYAESSNVTNVNKAMVYGEVKTDGILTKGQWNALEGCSHGICKDGRMQFCVDVREGLKLHLDALSDVFEFPKNWIIYPHLWFLNYMETSDRSLKLDNLEDISMRKVRESSIEVRKIIFG